MGNQMCARNFKHSSGSSSKSSATHLHLKQSEPCCPNVTQIMFLTCLPIWMVSFHFNSIYSQRSRIRAEPEKYTENWIPEHNMIIIVKNPWLLHSSFTWMAEKYLLLTCFCYLVHCCCFFCVKGGTHDSCIWEWAAEAAVNWDIG